jgi:hypothetical protein
MTQNVIIRLAVSRTHKRTFLRRKSRSVLGRAAATLREATGDLRQLCRFAAGDGGEAAIDAHVDRFVDEMHRAIGHLIDSASGMIAAEIAHAVAAGGNALAGPIDARPTIGLQRAIDTKRRVHHGILVQRFERAAENASRCSFVAFALHGAAEPKLVNAERITTSVIKGRLG